jgi:hypothetical protein
VNSQPKQPDVHDTEEIAATRKVRQFHGKSTDLSALQAKIESYLQSEGSRFRPRRQVLREGDSGEEGWGPGYRSPVEVVKRAGGCVGVVALADRRSGALQARGSVVNRKGNGPPGRWPK